ncbi:MAG: hypothetical protein ACOYLI_01125 [Synechococcus lacustris]
MKFSITKRIRSVSLSQGQAKADEQGVALILAVLMSIILLGISTGLLAKQLMTRRNGASESYKQMAETAASNGLNRILAKLNNSNTDISYLWRLQQNDQQGMQWNYSQEQLRPMMEQPCTPLLLDQQTSLVLAGGDLSHNSNLRDDGSSETVAMAYKLRSYEVSNQAIFQIEGIVSRGNTNPPAIASRSLLTRTLALKNVIPDANHWGALAATRMELGPSSIVGPGRAILLLTKADAGPSFVPADACSAPQLGARVGATNIDMKSKIWPLLLNPPLDKQFPSPGIFEQEVAVDQFIPSGSTSMQIRIWNIDDNRPANSLIGCNAIVCSRGELETSYKSLDSLYVSNGTITLPGSSLCADQQAKPCSLWIEKIKLSGVKKLLIASNQAVVLRMLRPLESISVVSPSSLCAAKSGETSCGQEAEHLAIVAKSGDSPSSCAAATQKLSFNGNAIPAALILMPQGTVNVTGSASMRGLIWAHQICATAGLALTTTSADGGNVVDKAKTSWHRIEDFSLGITVTKGMRGTGLDMFRRW